MIKLNKHGLISKRLIANEFIVGNTFIGVNGAPEDLTVLNLTKEEMDILSYIINSEGRNIPIDENGKIETKIGHTYVITTTEIEVTVTDADFNKLCKVPAHTQMGFVAKSALSYVDNVTCTVTEVFKAAAPIMLSENGSGKPKGDYVILDANGCITGGRLDTLVDGSYLQYGKKLTEWNIALPSLSNGTKMFDSSVFSKDAAILILNSLPAYSSGEEHIIDIGINHNYKHDTDINVAIASAAEKGWVTNAIWLLASNKLPDGYKRLEYLESTGTQYIDTEYVPNNETGIYLYQEKMQAGDTIPMGCRNSISTETRFYALRSATSLDEFGTGYGWGPWRPIQTIAGVSQTYLNYMNSQEVYGEGEGGGISVIFLDSLAFTPECSIFMFAANIGGVANLKWGGRIYETTISQGKAIAMSFIPCLDPEGAPCMFDLASETAFYNQGVGDFIYPTESIPYSLRRTLSDWGKLTKHGLKRLYYAPADYTGELYDYALENGYKPIIEPERPEEGYWAPRWTETEDEIVLEWVETEPPIDLEV